MSQLEINRAEAQAIQKAVVSMSAAKLVVKFNQHISGKRVRSMTTGIAAYGNVFADANGHELVVEVFRKSKLGSLRVQLTRWETFGYLRWHDDISK